MAIVHAFTDAEVSEQERRQSVYSGNLFVYSPRPSTLALSAASRAILETTLGPEPMWLQQRLSAEEFAANFHEAARSFSQNAIELAKEAATDFGCVPEATFVRAPFLVATTGAGFLARGLGAPHHPHRDTWYAAPTCQVNWWVPIYDLDASTAFAFHPSYWGVPVQNTSGEFDYDTWEPATESGWRIGDAQALSQPRSVDPIELAPDIRIRCPAGGVIISSVAHLYSAVPSETPKAYFSVHFQTVSEPDLYSGKGAANLDAAAHGTALPSFVRCSDLSPIPRELVQLDRSRRRAGSVPACLA